MLIKIKELWTEMCIKGIHLPYAYDPETDKPSITLMFFWITSFVAIISLIALHFKKDLLTGTLTSGLFVLLGFIMYRLRKLDKVKIDVDDQSIELESENKQEKE